MKKIVNTNKAPAAIGPYSQAIIAGNLLFTSGQIPVDPVTGSIEGSTIDLQTGRVMNNLIAILNEAGLTLDNVIKTTVFINDMNSFGMMNEIYMSYFSENNFPARSCVEVSRLPKDVLVEIEAIAQF